MLVEGDRHYNNISPAHFWRGEISFDQTTKLASSAFSWVGVTLSLVLSLMFYRSLFFLLAIVLSVLLRYTDSDYSLVSSNFFLTITQQKPKFLKPIPSLTERFIIKTSDPNPFIYNFRYLNVIDCEMYDINK